MNDWPLFTLIHVLGASIWIGSMVFYVVIISPFAKSRFEGEEYYEFLTQIGKKFSRLGWICLALISISGIFLSDIISGWEAFMSAQGHTFPPASTIAWKMLLGLILIIIVYFHDFKTGPKAVKEYRLNPDSHQTRVTRKRANFLARMMLTLSLVIFWLGITVLRGSVY